MIVVDASAMIRALLADPRDAPLRERFAQAGRGIHAPTHLDVEVLSAIVGLLRGRKIDPARADRMVAQFSAFRVSRHPTVRLARRVVALRHNFTAYDAAYLALAEALDAPLVTCDGKFADAPRTIHTATIDTYRNGTSSR